MDKTELYELMDAGVFNCIIKGYVLLAMSDATITQEQQTEIMCNLRAVLDDVSSQDAEAYYFKH